MMTRPKATARMGTADPTPRGTRLLALRNLDGLTQKELAERLHVSQSFISRVQNGTKPFPLELVDAAAQEFDVPASFFTVPLDVTEGGFPTFRKSSRAAVTQERMVTTAFGEAARLFRTASEASGYRPLDLTEAVVPDDEEQTAENVRSVLGLGLTDPVLNATRALERLGVGVIDGLSSIEVDASEHAGISRPNEQTDRPLIATVTQLPPAVSRLTRFHEFGHLLFDRSLTAPIRGTRAPQEQRAFRFAGAMLIPAAVVRKRISESLTLHGYLPVKADYGISVGALIKRAADLGVISAARKRSLYIQWSSQGWRLQEPVTVPAERPLLLRQAVERGISSDSQVVADETGVRRSLVEHWTDLHALSVDSGNVIAFPGRRRS